MVLKQPPVLISNGNPEELLPFSFLLWVVRDEEMR